MEFDKIQSGDVGLDARVALPLLLSRIWVSLQRKRFIAWRDRQEVAAVRASSLRHYVAYEPPKISAYDPSY